MKIRVLYIVLIGCFTFALLSGIYDSATAQDQQMCSRGPLGEEDDSGPLNWGNCPPPGSAGNPDGCIQCLPPCDAPECDDMGRICRNKCVWGIFDDPVCCPPGVGDPCNEAWPTTCQQHRNFCYPAFCSKLSGYCQYGLPEGHPCPHQNSECEPGLFCKDGGASGGSSGGSGSSGSSGCAPIASPTSTTSFCVDPHLDFCSSNADCGPTEPPHYCDSTGSGRCLEGAKEGEACGTGGAPYNEPICDTENGLQCIGNICVQT